jgi:hypothetical protein
VAKTETDKNGFFDVARAFGYFLFKADVEALVATRRKSPETLVRAGELAVRAFPSYRLIKFLEA